MGSARDRVEKQAGSAEEPPAKPGPSALDRLLRHLVDACPALIYLKDEQLRHIYGNQWLLEKMGMTLSELEGTTSSAVLPPAFAEQAERADREVLETQKTTAVAENQLEMGGQSVWVRDVKFPVEGPDGQVAVAGVAFDVTARVHAERALAEQLAFESLVADLAASLAATKASDLDRTIDGCLEKLGEGLGAERAFFGLFSHDQSILTLSHHWQAAGIEPPGSEILDTNLTEAFPWAAREMAAGRVISTGPGLSGLPEAARALREQLERDGIKSGLLVPIRVEGDSLGFIGVDSVREERDYSPELVERLRLLADVIGSTVRRIEAETALSDSLAEVKRLTRRLEKENIYLRREIESERTTHRIVGESPALLRVLEDARQVAATGSTVLILGETGTGKELLARLIHDTSDRSDRSLVKVNCATLPATLVESELFGRERGAYTGAMTRQIGRFEVADGSTIFLDEIGDLPLETQVKLLRVLEEGAFERLGSSKTIRVDARVLAATNRDLQAEVEAGRFREDLFYRLNVFPLAVPPLRERPGDIPLLVWSFVRELAQSMGKSVDTISRSTMDALERYAWPGNVRELRNVIERAMILCRGPALEIRVPESPGVGEAASAQTSLADAQRRHILKVLERTAWRVRGKGGAAELLEMKPSTLENRMKKLGIQRPR